MRIVRSNGDRYTIPVHDVPGTTDAHGNCSFIDSDDGSAVEPLKDGSVTGEVDD